uniref:Uncharacterized protein n=1 Tax=Romanomermis culicivorax TaxID=13658 RepID=A0A915HMN7_ROMCU
MNVREVVRSHFLDSLKKKNTEKNDDKTTGDSDMDRQDRDAQMRYKISSIKYDLMKKDKLIEDLENKIKSFHDKLEQISSDPKFPSNGGIQILKRELELNDDIKFSLNDNKTMKQLDFHVNEQLVTPFARLLMVSCFHIINAVLIVTLLSVYYSRDSDSEKQYTIAAITLVYIIVNFISMYLIQFHLAQVGSFFYSNNERRSKLFQHAVALAACTVACILMVYQVSMRYEDASTFFYSMLYLMGFCMFVNSILAMLVCKIFEGQLKMVKKSEKKHDWEKERKELESKNQQKQDKHQSVKNDELRKKQ